MAPTRAQPTVVIATRPMWQIRLAYGLPRYLLWATCIAGLAASARFAISPPRSTAESARLPTPAPPDLAGRSYASLFARRYLTWNAAEPEASRRSLAPLVGSGVEPTDGLRLPSHGEQHVDWVEVVQERESGPGEHVYTVAAQTDSAGLLYLTITVLRRADGSLALAGYPAFVGAPALGPATAPTSGREVGIPALATVVERALRNYLAGLPNELAADLTSDARVSLPALPIALQSMQRLTWSSSARSVLAVVQAEDGRGVEYTLQYELDVALTGGRWEVSAIQTDPDM